MHFCTRKLGVVQVEGKHRLKADDFVSLVGIGVDESRKGAVCSLCDDDFFHGIDGAAKLDTVYLSNFFHQYRDSKSATVLVLACVHRVETLLDQELRRHQIWGAFSKR